MIDPLSLLDPCPFCADRGGGEFRLRENRLNNMPDMGGRPRPVVSVELTHWCAPTPGQPSRNTITRTGRDMESVVALWNERSGVARLNAEQSRKFVETLLNPPEPNEALKAAAKRFLKKVEGE